MQIDSAISPSAEYVCQLPDREKIAFYQELLQLTGACFGEITLAAADQASGVPIAARTDGQFTACCRSGSFAGGLVLRRDLVEDNLTFERLIAVNRPQLVQLVASVSGWQILARPWIRRDDARTNIWSEAHAQKENRADRPVSIRIWADQGSGNAAAGFEPAHPAERGAHD